MAQTKWKDSKTGLGRRRTSSEGRVFAPRTSLSNPPRLIGGFCPICGEYSSSWHAACPACNCEQMEEVCLSRRGTLETFTIIRKASTAFKGPASYAVGAVVLPEGVKLSALVSGCPPEELRTGMEVELDFIKVAEDGVGNEVLAQAFRPV